MTMATDNKKPFRIRPKVYTEQQYEELAWLGNFTKEYAKNTYLYNCMTMSQLCEVFDVNIGNTPKYFNGDNPFLRREYPFKTSKKKGSPVVVINNSFWLELDSRIQKRTR